MAKYRYVPTQELLKHKLLTEQEILAIRKRLNGYSKSREMVKAFTGNEEISQPEWVKPEANSYKWREEYTLTPEQQEKGYRWCLNLYKTPRGIERKNNPFGYREQEVIDNYSHFTFRGLYDAQSSAGLSMGYHNYLPMYRMYGKDGDSFEYYAQSGEITIVG